MRQLSASSGGAEAETPWESRLCLSADYCFAWQGSGAILYPRRDLGSARNGAVFALTELEADLLSTITDSPTLAIGLRRWAHASLGVPWRDVPALQGASAADLGPLSAAIESGIRFVTWSTSSGVLSEVDMRSPAMATVGRRGVAAAPPTAGLPASNRCDQPVYVTLVPTFECGHRCIYCYLGAGKDEFGRELPWSLCERLIEECKALGMFQVRLTGGEVLLYSHSLKLLDGIHRRGMFLGKPLSTKLLVDDRRLRQLKDVGVKKLQYSLDSALESSVLATTSPRGGAAAGGYVAGLLASMQNAQRIGLGVVVRVTVSSRTCGGVEGLIGQVAKRLGIAEVVLAPVVADSRRVPRSLVPSRHQWRLVQDAVEGIIRASGGIRVRYKGSPQAIEGQELRSPDAFVESVRCPGNRFTLTVLPDGRATYCAALCDRPDYDIGNVSSKSIREVWWSRRALGLAYPSRVDAGGRPCGTCEEFDRCRHFAGRCYVRIADAYGSAAHHLPDPCCLRSSGAAYS